MPEKKEINLPPEPPIESSVEEAPFLSIEEIEKLTSDNVNLAYFFANKFIKNNRLVGAEIEEVTSQAIHGLVKAANTYNPQKGKFSSYASTIIQNYLRHMDWYHRERTSQEVTSLDAPLKNGEGGEEGEETLQSKTRSADEPTETSTVRSEASKILYDELNAIEEPKRSMVLRWMNGESYRDMQKDFKLSFMQIRNIVSKELERVKIRLAKKGILNLNDILPESFDVSNGKFYRERLLEAIDNSLLLKLVK